MLRAVRPLIWCAFVFVGAGSSMPPASAADVGKVDLTGRAEGVLKAYCYRCHGQGGRNEGGLNFVTDLKKLVDSKRVIPGEPGRSKLLQRVIAGDMPPDVDFDDQAENPPPLPRPSPAEIALIGDWIKAGAPATAAKPTAPRFRTDLDVASAMLEDLRKLNPRERKFSRYFTLTHLANAGYNEDQLQTYRLGLSKLINSLSWNRRIKAPTPIDPARTVLRIDLRDYLWDDGIWQEIADHNPYGLQKEDGPAQTIAELTGCDQPHVRADWFVFAASRPPLYHDLLRLPETIEELERKLDVDVEANIRQDRAARAGFNASGVSRNNRLIERHESTNGAYWRSYDFAGNADRKNLFSHPLGPGDGDHDFEYDGGEIVFTLPNGLNGYMLINANGKRIDKGPTEIVRDNKQSDGAVVNGISCMSCHNRGFIEKTDQVRDVVARSKAFDKDVAETVLVLYPPKDRMEELFKGDLERFAKAVKQTGAALSRTEPVFALATQFEDEINLPLAAAEAGLPIKDFENLLERTPKLGQTLGPLLVDGTVKRDVYVDAFAMIAEARHLEPREGGLESNAMPGTGGRVDSRNWVVLFRGRNPRAWNTRSQGETKAIPLNEAPSDMQFLRLRRLDTKESLIIPLTRDRLGKASSSRDDPSSPWRWCGTNEHHWGGWHLGISEGPLILGTDQTGRGKVAVQVEFVHYYAGSGFGHQAHGDDRTQFFGWHGQPIPPTDFEIAVSRGPLSFSEKANLVSAEPKSKPTAVTSTTSAGGRRKPYAAEQLVDLPREFFGGNHNAFRDVAPAGGVLVGVRVGYVDAFGGSKIGSLQPIFRIGRTLIDGERHGVSTGLETTAIAKPGYAVGGLRFRSALMIDGFEMAFMKIKGDRLDPNDTYNSPWLGDEKGGNPGSLSAEGHLVVGVHGRSDPEVKALGFVVVK